jgi:hypothetical protein
MNFVDFVVYNTYFYNRNYLVVGGGGGNGVSNKLNLYKITFDKNNQIEKNTLISSLKFKSDEIVYNFSVNEKVLKIK